MSKQSMELPMFAIVIAISLIVFVGLAGTEVVLSNISSDELRNMGVDKQQ